MNLKIKQDDGTLKDIDTKDIVSQLIEYKLADRVVYLMSLTYREFLDTYKSDAIKLSAMNPTVALEYLKTKVLNAGLDESMARHLYLTSEEQIYESVLGVNLITNDLEEAIKSLVGFGQLNKDVGFFMIIEETAKKFKKDPTKHIQKTYIIKNKVTSLIKIGKSKNPTQRIKSLSKSAGYELEVIHIFEDDIEGILHKRFSHKRGIGEWFDLCEDEISLAISEYSEVA